MTTARHDLSDTVATITGRLAAHHDGLTVLRTVTDACAGLLDAPSTGVIITDPRGGLTLLAASDEQARFAELLQVQTEEGPCVDSIAENTLLHSADLETESRWPQFRSSAMEAGYRAVYAFPMRLLDRAVGGLNLLYREPTELSEANRRLGQALADLAVLGLTQEHDQRRAERLAEQTLTTLNDRVQLSQATGMLMGTLALSADEARALLYEHGRRTGRPVREIAQAITQGQLTPEALSG